MTKTDVVNKIIKKLGPAALAGQGAEECCELAQALLKFQRIVEGVNPAAFMTEQDAVDNITEEIADVKNLIEMIEQALGISEDDVHMLRTLKMVRWMERMDLKA